MNRRSARADARLLGRAIRITLAASPGPAVALHVLVVASSALPVATVWLSKVVVDRLATGRAATAAALAYSAVLLAGWVVQPFERLLSAGIEERTVGEVDHRLMDVATRLVDMDRIERPAFHDELAVVRRGAAYIPRSILLVQRGVRLPLALVGVLALLIGLNPLLPAALGVVTVAHVLAEQRMSKRRHDAMVRRSEAAREMDYCTRITTDPAAAKEVRVLGIGDFFRDRYRHRAAQAVAEMRTLRLASLRTTAVLALAHAAVIGGGFVYVAARAGTGGLTPGDLALYLSAVVEAEMASWGLAFVIVHGHETLINLRVVLPFLDNAQPAISLAAPGAGLPAPQVLTGGVELRNVCFRYPQSNHDVLNQLNALLPAGKVTAIVGANGAGKSTLVKLLGRMYDPVSGVITVDGDKLADLDLAEWRSRLSAVHQDFARLSLTMAENISVGDDRATHEQMDAASRWAGADQVAARLPRGMDTPLTRRFAGGVELSGGEWQKVALARGAVRPAALVLLDEPTAGLDADAEYRLFQQFRQLVAGRTGLLISHRFSTVRMADNIVVVEDGQVLEAGTHQDLVSVGGRYAQLYEMQAGRYR